MGAFILELACLVLLVFIAIMIGITVFEIKKLATSWSTDAEVETPNDGWLNESDMGSFKRRIEDLKRELYDTDSTEIVTEEFEYLQERKFR